MSTYLFKDKELVDYMMSFQSGVSPVEVRNELLNKVDELINEYDGEIPAYRNDIDSILSLSDIFDDMFRSMIERADEAGIDVEWTLVVQLLVAINESLAWMNIRIGGMVRSQLGDKYDGIRGYWRGLRHESRIGRDAITILREVVASIPIRYYRISINRYNRDPRADLNYDFLTSLMLEHISSMHELGISGLIAEHMSRLSGDEVS